MCLKPTSKSSSSGLKIFFAGQGCFSNSAGSVAAILWQLETFVCRERRSDGGKLRGHRGAYGRHADHHRGGLRCSSSCVQCAEQSLPFRGKSGQVWRHLRACFLLLIWLKTFAMRRNMVRMVHKRRSVDGQRGLRQRDKLGTVAGHGSDQELLRTSSSVVRGLASPRYLRLSNFPIARTT